MKLHVVDQKKRKVYKLKGYGVIGRGKELELIETLQKTKPISIIMDSNHMEFLFYKTGVLRIPTCSSENLNHAALAVGYNLEDGNNRHLIVKNSFGSQWGEGGYFRIALFEGNMCGIATRATFPIPLI
uniref:Cathepsin L2 (Trinotate prediction) n=1 Tax=Myxobolus squamalis TaxID=59785 RepID=A0A6B2FXU9_MYXSQ